MKKSTLQITEGAMILAIMGVFFLIDRQLVGSISSTFAFILPIPLAVYTTKYQDKAGLVVLFSAFILNILLVNPFLLFIVMAQETIGFFYGHLVGKGYSFRQILWRMMLVGSLVQLIDFTLSIKLFGLDINAEMKNMLDMLDSFPTLKGFYTPKLLRNMVYLSSILLGVLQAFSTCLLSQILLERIKLPAPKMDRLSQYRPSRLSGYISSVGFLIFPYLIQSPLSIDWIQMALLTFSMLSMFYLLFWGWMTITIWLIRIRIPKPVAVLLIMVLTIPFSVIFILIGLVTIFYPRIRGE